MPKAPGTPDTFCNNPDQNQPKTVMMKIVIQRQMFGFSMHEAPYMGNLGDHEPKGW